jgi:DNA-binding CsgD family transcriptional regulator
LEEADPTSDRYLWLAGMAAFLGVAALAATDLFSDLSEGASQQHLLTEGGILLLGTLGSAFAAFRLIQTLGRARAAQARAESLARRLSEKAEEATRWKDQTRDLLRGLSAAIDQQFDAWGLSDAEKEVALLLLKGLSHREISQIRRVTESTARQQARAVYKKAELEGRHDLSAFFLEDLMLPTAAPRNSPESS